MKNIHIFHQFSTIFQLTSAKKEPPQTCKREREIEIEIEIDRERRERQRDRETESFATVFKCYALATLLRIPNPVKHLR